MKAKLCLTLLLGFSLIGCSVDPIDEEIVNPQISEIDAGAQDIGCAGSDNSKTITFSEASALESWDEVRKLYISLLAPGVPKNGTFDPKIWDIIRDFQKRGLGDYPTTYQLNGECTDSVILTISVIPDPVPGDPICDGFSAGADASMEIELSVAAALESWDEVRKLYVSLLAPGVPKNGTFDPTVWNIINQFNVNANPLGEYTTTYTITKDDCTDSVQLTVIVVPDRQEEPVCTLSAGSNNLKEIKQSEAAAIESWDEVRKLYINLLSPGVPENGTFDPSIWDIIRQFNSSNVKTGDYTTTYTITEGDCTASVKLTMRVIAD
jgi:hypothetical protein